MYLAFGCGALFTLLAEIAAGLACWATWRYVKSKERAKQEIELARLKAESDAEMAKLKAADEAREKKNEYKRQQYAENPQVPLRDKARKIVSSAITKEAKLLIEYGVSVADMIVGIREQFDPAMSFSNHGIVWELDHIKPLSSFDLTDSAEFVAAISPYNLQPAFVGVNRQKGGTDLQAFAAEVNEQTYSYAI